MWFALPLWKANPFGSWRSSPRSIAAIVDVALSELGGYLPRMTEAQIERHDDSLNTIFPLSTSTRFG